MRDACAWSTTGNGDGDDDDDKDGDDFDGGAEKDDDEDGDEVDDGDEIVCKWISYIQAVTGPQRWPVPMMPSCFFSERPG